jgi:hypothetical protein
MKTHIYKLTVDGDHGELATFIDWSNYDVVYDIYPNDQLYDEEDEENPDEPDPVVVDQLDLQALDVSEEKFQDWNRAFQEFARVQKEIGVALRAAAGECQCPAHLSIR